MRQASLITVLAAIVATSCGSGASAQTASLFEGFYFGAHGGYGKVDNDSDEDVEGGLGGLHAGYNYVSGTLLLGIEGDYDWSDISYSRSETIDSYDVAYDGSVNYFASIRARLGLVHGSMLYYATAGYSWSEIEANVVVSGYGSGNASAELSGAVLGGGAEYKFSKTLSARLEGLHYWGGNEDELGDDEVQTNVIRAGLSYHLK